MVYTVPVSTIRLYLALSVGYTLVVVLTTIASSQIAVAQFDLSGSELEHIRTWRTVSSVTALAIDTSQHCLAAGAASGGIRLFDLEKGSEMRRLPGHDGSVRVVTFGSQTGRLFSGGEDGYIKVWNPITWEVEQRLHVSHDTDNPLAPLAVSVDPKEKWLLIAEDTGASLWDLDASMRRYVYPSGDTSVISNVCFTSDGASALMGGGGTAQAWDIPRNKRLWMIRRPRSMYDPVGLFLDGQRVALCSFEAEDEDSECAVWNGPKQEVITRLATDSPTEEIEVADKGRSVWTLHPPGTIVHWNAADGKVVARYFPEGIVSGAFTVSNDGTVIAASGDHRIVVVFAGKEARVKYYRFLDDEQK